MHAEACNIGTHTYTPVPTPYQKHYSNTYIITLSKDHGLTSANELAVALVQPEHKELKKLLPVLWINSELQRVNKNSTRNMQRNFNGSNFRMLRILYGS